LAALLWITQLEAVAIDKHAPGLTQWDKHSAE
jgi:hypothetical protein